MSRFKKNVESMIRQRKLRIIKDPTLSMLLDNIITLRDEKAELEAELAKAKKPTPKKKTDDS